MKWRVERLEGKIEFDKEKPDYAVSIAKSGRFVSKMICYEKGQSTPVHLHKTQDEIFHVIQGKGTITLDGEAVLLEPMTAIFVPAGTQHGIRADRDSRLVITFVKSPGKGQKIIK